MLKARPTAKVEASPGFRQMFSPGRLSVGLHFPIESFQGDEPTILESDEALASQY